MRYSIGSGFYGGAEKSEFFAIWLRNLAAFASPDPTRLSIVSVGNSLRPFPSIGAGINWINLDGNLGHVGDLIHGKKDHSICGWTAGVCALAMLAYSDESDFIYREEDCLCFGPWVQQLYTDMGDGVMAFGGPMKSEPYMECAQSLFIVRHSFIPKFVSELLSMGDERSKDDSGKEDNLPERKFHRIRALRAGTVKELSFGVDRERPLPYDSPVWYAQKFTPEELSELKTRGLI